MDTTTCGTIGVATFTLERAEGPIALCGKKRVCGEVILNG